MPEEIGFAAANALVSIFAGHYILGEKTRRWVKGAWCLVAVGMASVDSYRADVADAWTRKLQATDIRTALIGDRFEAQVDSIRRLKLLRDRTTRSQQFPPRLLIQVNAVAFSFSDPVVSEVLSELDGELKRQNVQALSASDAQAIVETARGIAKLAESVRPEDGQFDADWGSFDLLLEKCEEFNGVILEAGRQRSGKAG